MNQTAVEWLQNRYDNCPEYHSFLTDEDFEQAKDMDKEQKAYFFECGRQFQLTGEGTFTEVYTETFKNK